MTSSAVYKYNTLNVVLFTGLKTHLGKCTSGKYDLPKTFVFDLNKTLICQFESIWKDVMKTFIKNIFKFISVCFLMTKYFIMILVCVCLKLFLNRADSVFFCLCVCFLRQKNKKIWKQYEKNSNDKPLNKQLQDIKGESLAVELHRN